MLRVEEPIEGCESSFEGICFFFFFFNDPATTEIYTLPLHDALPICRGRATAATATTLSSLSSGRSLSRRRSLSERDRKSTRLNSSHSQISYAVFCLKKKKKVHALLPAHRARPHARIIESSVTEPHDL